MEDGGVPEQPRQETGGSHQGVRHTEPEERCRARKNGANLA